MVCLIRVRVDDDPHDHELLFLLEESKGLLCDLLKSEAIPMLDDLIIKQILRAQTPRVVVSHDLLQMAFNEDLERGSLGDLSVDDQIIALADIGNVVFLDGRGLGQGGSESVIHPE